MKKLKKNQTVYSLTGEKFTFIKYISPEWVIVSNKWGFERAALRDYFYTRRHDACRAFAKKCENMNILWQEKGS